MSQCVIRAMLYVDEKNVNRTKTVFVSLEISWDNVKVISRSIRFCVDKNQKEENDLRLFAKKSE